MNPLTSLAIFFAAIFFGVVLWLVVEIAAHLRAVRLRGARPVTFADVFDE